MITIKSVLSIFVVLLLLYGVIVLFPKKLSLLRRYGLDKTNGELIDLAKSGKEDLQKFARISKIYITLLLIAVVSLSIIN